MVRPRATHEGSKSHNPSLQADNPYILPFSKIQLLVLLSMLRSDCSYIEVALYLILFIYFSKSGRGPCPPPPAPPPARALNRKKKTKEHQIQKKNTKLKLTNRDAALESHQGRPESLETFQPSLRINKVKNENDAMWNWISDDFDKRHISRPKIQ